MRDTQHLAADLSPTEEIIHTVRDVNVYKHEIEEAIK